MRHFLSNERDRETAQKRGGGSPVLPLELDTAEGRYQLEPADVITPETIYNRRWALTLLDRTLQRLRAESRSPHFERLQPLLTGEADRGGYSKAAADTGMSEGAVKVAVHRLRKRYRSIVQSPRLLGCAGEALPWLDKKQYSAAAIGLDRAGRLVFIHARAALTMAELSQTLAGLDLAGALFLEGGPEASLVVRGSEGELLRMGSYETNFVENDANQAFWWLPNIIGLEAR